ncbi:MAG: NAD(+) diphosphatase [Myxococcales bacterium]|nr:NAD(+) diphosphatase [Myxococcales bacterium]
MPFTPAVSSAATTGRLFVIAGAGLCVVTDPQVAVPIGPPDGALHLGDLDGAACFARLVEDGGPPPGTEVMPLRQLFGVLTDDEFAVAGRALGLTAWDRDHRHCGRCGAATARSDRERVRTCGACGLAAYPRLSPAVIVLVERDGRCLLARNARTRMPFFSTLAGFVEVGETLEECVAREIHEEAGLELTDVRYFGSQPWPFTGSLMVGFTARWASGEIVEDPTEIADAGWFAPDALPVVPPPLSIARALIDDFVRRHGGRLISLAEGHRAPVSW